MPSTIGGTLEHAQFLARHLNGCDPQYVAIAVLMDLGIDTNRDGFAYLLRAVVLFMSNPLCRTTKDMFPAIGQCCEPSVDGRLVEQAIRSAIVDAWKERDESVWVYYFQPRGNGSIKKPSNGEFISRVAYFLILLQGCYKKEVCNETE